MWWPAYLVDNELLELGVGEVPAAARAELEAGPVRQHLLLGQPQVVAHLWTGHRGHAWVTSTGGIHAM